MKLICQGHAGRAEISRASPRHRRTGGWGVAIGYAERDGGARFRGTADSRGGVLGRCPRSPRARRWRRPRAAPVPGRDPPRGDLTCGALLGAARRRSQMRASILVERTRRLAQTSASPWRQDA
jgi:hypothetical protein